MDNNFESLFKTDEAIEQPSQNVEDVLKYSKVRIRAICKAFCLSAKKYDPSRTVSAIQNYLKEQASRERILYSEISSFVYGLPFNEQGNFATLVFLYSPDIYSQPLSFIYFIISSILALYFSERYLFKQSLHKKNHFSNHKKIYKKHYRIYISKQGEYCYLHIQ